MARATLSFLLMIVLICPNSSRAQRAGDSESHSALTTVAGILLVTDRRCNEWPYVCPDAKGASRWGLMTLSKQYFIFGNTPEIQQYARRRVTVTGRISPGPETWIDRLDAESVRPSEVPESELRDLIRQLRQDRWETPKNMANPTSWRFYFTPPMRQILQAGPAAQDVLLEYLNDSQIKDQIILLLGGIGNGKAVGPIIDAMANEDETRENAYARKVNLVANLALTNLTVADVIWHHGGGITIDRCPDDPKSCWYAWWLEHRATFDVSKTPSRNYSNYPSYGIYQDPGLFRSEALQP
jgi:hypothetical protein